jgi:hypothetical protein
MIGIVGTIVLLPLALLGLAYGFARFGLNALRTLFEEAFGKVHRLSLRT